MRTNAKGKLYVGVLAVLAGLLAGVAAFFVSDPTSAKPEPTVSTVSTGEWISTCSGGALRSACTQGVLQVTFKDGTKTHVPMRSSATYGPTLDVVSKGAGWVVYTGESASSASLWHSPAVSVALILMWVLVGGVAAVFLAVATVPNWGRARLYA